MSQTVFILGAGASKESEAPLMNDFLDTAEDLLLKGLQYYQNLEVQKAGEDIWGGF